MHLWCTRAGRCLPLTIQVGDHETRRITNYDDWRLRGVFEICEPQFGRVDIDAAHLTSVEAMRKILFGLLGRHPLLTHLRLHLDTLPGVSL
jgi:hypothetical protein